MQCRTLIYGRTRSIEELHRDRLRCIAAGEQMVCDCQPCEASSDHSVSPRRHGDILCCIVRRSCWAYMPRAGFAANRRRECAQ